MIRFTDKKFSFYFFIYLLILGLSTNLLSSQPSLPQRTLTITATQPLHFGTFGLVGSSGGTVTVGFDGTRIASSGIFLASMAPVAQPAIFDIKLCQGRTILITYPNKTYLTGSNGGTMDLEIGPTEKGVNGSTFPVENNCDFITTLRVGGKITIPGASPAGLYTGYIQITFDQQ